MAYIGSHTNSSPLVEDLEAKWLISKYQLICAISGNKRNSAIDKT